MFFLFFALGSVFSERVLVRLPVLHDHGDVVLVHQEQQVFDGVANDQENVGISSFLDDSQVSLRIAVERTRELKLGQQVERITRGKSSFSTRSTECFSRVIGESYSRGQ